MAGEKIASWLSVTASAGENRYYWTASANLGRASRSTTVTVMTTDTVPVYSASTVFNQDGVTPFLNVVSTNPLTVGSNPGSFIATCETNLSSVDVYISGSHERNWLPLTNEGMSPEAGILYKGEGILSSSTLTIYRINFLDDPGANNSFHFYVTCSYTNNPDSNNRSSQVNFVTNSMIVASLFVTQSVGGIGGGDTPVEEA